MQPKLGILAGGGKLPALIVEICRLSGRSIHVIKFKGYADEIPSYVPSTEVRLGAGGKTIKVLRENDVKEIILAGSVSRPSFTQLRPDAWGIKFLARTGAISLSDHSLFTAILGAIEGEGFRIVGVADTAPQLLADIGQISSRKPNEKEYLDIKLAVRAARDLGAKDIGQAAIVRNQEIIGLEDSSGTDALLKRIKIPSGSFEGVLAKVVKPQQDLRIDLPTIGVNTLANVARAGLAGVAVEAGKSIILDRKDVISIANELNLFLVGI